MVKGDEERVEDLFVAFLQREGWSVKRQVDFLDVYAERDGEELRAEVKGLIGSSMNLDVDTMFGQLLRHMAIRESRYAVVVPTEALRGVARVPRWVRDALGIEVFEVKLAAGDVVPRVDL